MAPNPLNVDCRCGGEVVYEDMRGRASKEFRYEAFCRKCKTCDPNGYATVRELKRESPRFWNPKRRLTAPRGQETNVAECRKCKRQFDWDAGDGYKKDSDGSFLCSPQCEFAEVSKRANAGAALAEAVRKHTGYVPGTILEALSAYDAATRQGGWAVSEKPYRVERVGTSDGRVIGPGDWRTSWQHITDAEGLCESLNAAFALGAASTSADGMGEAKFGEPWNVGLEYSGSQAGNFNIDKSSGDPVVLFIDRPTADRIVACVNALAGVADPAAFVAARPRPAVDVEAISREAAEAVEEVAHATTEGEGRLDMDAATKIIAAAIRRAMALGVVAMASKENEPNV